MGKRLTISPGTQPRGRGRRAGKKRAGWRRHGTVAGGIVVLALIARTLVLQGYRVPSRSMEDTVRAGEYLLVDKISYGARLPYLGWRLPGLTQPQAGDVLVFRAWDDPGRAYIKRCVAVGGQVVEVRNKVVYVDDRRIVDPPHSKYMDARILAASRSPRDNYGPVRVPTGTIFLIGDSRDNSRDSRHWGPAPLEEVLGRVLRVYWSCEAAPPSTTRGVGLWLQRVRSLPSRLRWQRLGAAIE